MDGADYVPILSTCHRCGDKSLERLTTHTYCINCNYSNQQDDDWPKAISVPNWAVEAFRRGKKVTFYKGCDEPVIEEYDASPIKEADCA